jgi:replication factor C subunit 2/4
MNESWVEKFRPKKLDDISSQEDIVHSLQNCINIKNIPHMLFFGPSGCGKTSAILAMARELFGENNYEDRVIELNASDERGIKIVRGKIKRYAMNAITTNENLPPWKIIILDEADNMTPDSQFALRKIMEDYSKVTRFCIICNYHNKIIDPIISRCSMYRFKPIPIENIFKKLTYICKTEEIICSDESINKIIDICRGDMRKAINFLQRCKNHRNFYENQDTINNVNIINNELINEISGLIPDVLILEFIEKCIKCKIDKVEENIDYFYKNGFSLTLQIYNIINIISNHKNITSKQKSLIIESITAIDNHLLNGCDEYIEYMKLGYSIMNFMN